MSQVVRKFETTQIREIIEGSYPIILLIMIVSHDSGIWGDRFSS
ncbi:MAG: hypothetical protein V7K85_03705 [Nostoc sp.]